MSQGHRDAYRFVTRAQWEACLTSGFAPLASDAATVLLRPSSPLLVPPQPTFLARNAFAPAVSRQQELLWRATSSDPKHDDRPVLNRVPLGYETALECSAPTAIGCARRMIASGDDLWVAGARAGTVECYELATLVRRFVVELPEGRVVDVAPDRHGAVLVLLDHADSWQIVPISTMATLGAAVELDARERIAAFAYVRADGRFVALTEDGRRLVFFDRQGGAPRRRVACGSLAPSFVGRHVASDGRRLVCVAGRADDGEGAPLAIVLDGAGIEHDQVELPEPATGIAVGRDAVLVTGADGLRVLPFVTTVPDDCGEVAALLITPMLEAPETEDGRRWLRIELRARLPLGATLEVASVATDDPEERDALLAIAGDEAQPPALRVQRLLAAPPFAARRVSVFHGDEATARADTTFAVPLHDVHARYLWIAVTLAASGGADLPTLSRLEVLHPGAGLMAQLPAIYQRDEAAPGSFLRGLVGVLETTTQDLDERIGRLGALLDADRAPGEWLDHVARWIGVPWDDALAVEQKRCILRRAARLAQGRGTRAGLEILLECLAPGSPRRFRIVDVTAEHGLARLAGGDLPGSTLPVVLGGPSATSARLDVQARLGTLRLPESAAQVDDLGARFLGCIRIDLAATGQEREAWRPWLAGVVSSMLPLGTHASFRWTTLRGLHGDRLDDAVLEDDPPPRLGTDAVVGVSRLPAGPAALPTSPAGGDPILH